ncbi:MAG: ferredoxin family protein [Deltaproteobacteria bacterium]|jgi:adenylylsulfate reductase subunit B|nr:ferredoxin family protein [Deltaproteobacteria bacterium]
MSIQIDINKCIDCGQCLDICPGGLIVRKEHIDVENSENCWGCCSCLKVCPTQAIYMFLAPSIGGRGAFLTFKRQDSTIHWEVHFPNRQARTIQVDALKANSY